MITTDNTYDIHNRAQHSQVMNYSDSALTTFTSLQDINYYSYDRYVNVLSQTIDSYSTQTVDEANLIDHKVITNEYSDAVARRRGNASLTTVVRYTSLAEDPSNEIDKTVTATTLFDNRGFAVDQVTDSFVYDKTSAKELLSTRRLIHNENIDNRGDSHSQTITTLETDPTGLEDTLEVVSYQKLTNRKYDSQHNILNQMIFTYADKDAEGNGVTLLDVQEVRQTGFHSSGVALKQVIVTYSDASRSEIIDCKVIENSGISANGNVGVTTITRYSLATVVEDGGITPAEGTEIDKQTITTDSFDVRGNALHQTVIREYYDEGEFKFS